MKTSRAVNPRGKAEAAARERVASRGGHRKQSTPQAELRAYIAKSPAQFQALFRSARTALRKRLPAANELAYDYGKFVLITYSPTANGIEGIVSIAARPDGVRLYFMHGPKLPDPKGLLVGSAGQTRYLEVTKASQLRHRDTEALIKAAIAAAKVPLPRRGKGGLFIRGRGAKTARR
jgi:hypothetical protein